MMRWPHLARPFLFTLVVASLLLPMASASADLIIGVGQATYERAGEGDNAAHQLLQMQLFHDAYQLGASSESIASETLLPGALASLDRTILWPVDRDGKAWPVLDHGKNTFGWNRWPRIEYDSRNAFNVACTFTSEEDRFDRHAESYPCLMWAGSSSPLGLLSIDDAEARIPALLIQPILAYYRMYGELPATPGDAYRELGIAMIDEAELELLEHYTLEFFASTGSIQLRLTPRNRTMHRIEANAWLDTRRGAYVLESRRLNPWGNFSTSLLLQRAPVMSCIQTDVYQKVPGSELTLWATWRAADIPVIATPVTDFLRNGPTIQEVDELALARKARNAEWEEAMAGDLHVGPKFDEAKDHESPKS